MKQPRLFIDATETGIKEVGFGGRKKNKSADSRYKSAGALAKQWRIIANKELNAYFSGRRRSFSMPCDLSALPPFTQAVLKVAAKIPFGEVRSYRWIAKRLKKPKASRAVGNALARNPIPIIIPCHRVVRSDGALGGYTLGLGWKRKLLELEKTQLALKR